jgi:hypothetical protein
MAVILNAKGTSQSNFRIGKRGSKIFGTSDAPSDVSNISTGDLWFDSSNTLLKIATVSGGSVSWNKLTVGDADTLDSINSTSFARTDEDTTFANDVTITGNLTVNGTQTVVNTQTLNIADNEIVLNSDLPSNQPATANAGILVNRGNESNVFVRWDEDEGEWTVNGETFSAGAFVGNLSGNVTGSIAPNGAPNVVKANTFVLNGTTITASGTELNYTDGVTSNIQTQLDAKLALAGGTMSGNIDMGNSSVLGVNTLRINENGTGLRMTNVGAFDNSNGDFRVFSTGNLILSTNGDSGTAVTIDQSTKDATFQGNIIVNSLTYPTADGTDGQVIKTDGSGTLSFGAIPAGGSNTEIQYNYDGGLKGTSNFKFDEATDKLTIGGAVEAILFETLSDYGSITTTANAIIDYGSITDTVIAIVNNDYGTLSTGSGPVEFPQYTVSTLPDADVWTGHMIYVSNETGGATMAFSDGTNWRRIQDRAIVS